MVWNCPSETALASSGPKTPVSARAECVAQPLSYLSKHIQNYTDWLAQEVAQLTEEGVALLGRLGCGAEKLGLGDDDGGDKYGGRLEEDDYQAGAAALEAMRAKKKKTPEDKEAITKQGKALSAIRSRAIKKVKREKDQERAKELPGRVAELEKEVCLLEFALDVM